MIVNPVTITMPRHELEQLLAEAAVILQRISKNTARGRVLESAVLRLEDELRK